MANGIGGAIKKWLTISRWWSFYTDFMAVTVGSVLALPRFSIALYVAMLAATISINAFANLVNDIYDFKHGEGSHKGVVVRYPNPILNKSATMNRLWAAAIVSIVIASLCGVYITIMRGPVIVLLGLVGILLAYTYSAGRHSTKSMALGELVVFLTYGPLMTSAAYFVMAGRMVTGAALTSIIVGMAIMLILFANNIRDIKADKAMGMRTMAVRLGQKRSINLFNGFYALMYVLLVAYIAVGAIPVLSALALLSAPYAFKINRIMRKKVPDNSAELASRLALLFAVLFSSGVIAQFALTLH